MSTCGRSYEVFHGREELAVLLIGDGDQGGG